MTMKSTIQDTAGLRAHLQRGGHSVGGWMQIPDDSVAEIMGAAGYDWVALDLEHGRFCEHDLAAMFRALELGKCLPFARVGEVTPYAIKAVLESGGRGIILPMIETADQLAAAIGWAHYPPRGTRGVGYSRANIFGKTFENYSRTIDPFVVAQIEHVRAIENIEAILAVKGLDAVMIGPYDLSASMGLTGEFEHPDFKQAVANYTAACRKMGTISGIHVIEPQPEKLQSAISDGHRFIAYGTDAIFLWRSAQRPQ